MKIKKIEFVKSLASASGFEDNMGQIAIVGRSNVGKSSFINMLANNNKLAKTSSTPGRTRLINLFKVNDSFLLVDLPGYGFAKTSDAEQNRWAEMIDEYLHTTSQLKAVILLLDIRQTPSIKDLQMLDWLVKYNLPVIFIATKFDKIKKSEKIARLTDLAKTLKVGRDDIIVTSAQTGEGKEQALNKIFQFIENT